jgi:dihydroorotate dehydrogenase electron transfer subunit
MIQPPMVQLESEILDNRPVAREHFLLSLAAPPIASHALPGQFLMLRPGRTADPLLPRAFSFFAVAPGRGRVDLLYRVVGAGTRVMSALRPGDRVAVWGPLGQPFTPIPSTRMLLVGGGVGVPPIVFMAARHRQPLPAHGDSAGIEAFIGAATAEFVVGTEELVAASVPVQVATDDGTLGHRGYVTDLLQGALGSSTEETTVYACGPMPMLAAVARICSAAGVACQVALEAPMACGVGACLGCTVPRIEGGYARVCTDGPVFDAAAIAWGQIR